MAIVLGVGYPNPNRSHFRSMDIWHTCEPDKIGTEGWLGRTIQALDPNTENVLTAVNFGRGLPRAMVKDGVPVASVGNLETYGLLNGIEGERQRDMALEVFDRMYSNAIGSSAVISYIRRTGYDALKGADVLGTAPALYSSSAEYSDSSEASTCEISRRYTWQVSVLASFIQVLPTTPSTPTPTNREYIARSGRTFPGTWRLSRTT